MDRKRFQTQGPQGRGREEDEGTRGNGIGGELSLLLPLFPSSLQGPSSAFSPRPQILQKSIVLDLEFAKLSVETGVLALRSYTDALKEIDDTIQSDPTKPLCCKVPTKFEPEVDLRDREKELLQLLDLLSAID